MTKEEKKGGKSYLLFFTVKPFKKEPPYLIYSLWRFLRFILYVFLVSGFIAGIFVEASMFVTFFIGFALVRYLDVKIPNENYWRIKKKKEEQKIRRELREREREELFIEMDRLKELRRRRKIREKAEKVVFGASNRKRRIILTEEEKEMIFQKFGYKCAIDNKTEGLHIHHKDQNPSNNNIDNLILLCGVCHKKVHMKVR